MRRVATAVLVGIVVGASGIVTGGLAVAWASDPVTWYAAPSAAGDGSCSSELNPCPLATAIEDASDGDTVEVAGGTYPTTGYEIGTSISVVAEAGTVPVLESADNSSGTIVTVDSGTTVRLQGLKIDDSVVAITTSGTLTVDDVTLSGNVEDVLAFDDAGPTTIEDSDFSGSHQGTFGRGAFTITNSTIDSFDTDGSTSHSQLSGDLVTGAVGAQDSAGIDIDDSTLRNTDGPAANPAAWAIAGGVINISRSSIVDAHAHGLEVTTQFDNLYGSTGTSTITLASSIVADNSGTACTGPVTDDGYNISDDGSCGFTAPGSVSQSPVIDDYLGSLSDNSGPTQTVPLLASPSPATDQPDPAAAVVPESFDVQDGSSACAEPDQRVVSRPPDHCDVGAFELTHPATATLTGSPQTGVEGQPVTLTATVAGFDGAGAPTGYVKFEDAGAPIGGCGMQALTPGPDDTSTATCLTSELPRGTDDLSAVYSGDGTYPAGEPAALSYQVLPPGPGSFPSPAPGVTDPTITAHLASAGPPRSAAGWYRSPVTISYTCTPGSAPLNSSGCPDPVTITGNGKDQHVTRTVTATDGGSASTTTTLSIDRDKPHVHVHGAHNGRTYRHPRAITCTATDRVSGLSGACTTSSHRHRDTVHYVAMATDNADNTTIKHGHYYLMH